ncbi:glycoside hydrolase family 48 protein [Paenibacillus hubeiensis]|uniref:glycoside hydrolase family 48 protein n=1 Tax=Paenibacillus hubeiensis TaxID=3077330 RepID=UPI0031BBC287
MLKSAAKKSLAAMLAGTVMLTGYTGLWAGPQTVFAEEQSLQAEGINEARFMELYGQLKDPANGYFSPEGIPYHSVETLISEAPDYGHMTTSEAYSYWLWLETMYGHFTGDWSKLEAAWDNMEKYIIPVNEGDGKEEQPTMSHYNPNSPATYAAEKPFPDQYPSELNGQYQAGRDPLDAELKSSYGNNQTYLMHWLLDVDNWYGFGNLLNPSHTAAYVNTFQRGEQESVWEAVPHPSQDDKSFGKAGEGFMSLFTKENQAPAAQWRYTNATDADARAVQVLYWAKEMGYDNQAYLDKAKKMGDYLRYGLHDKYFQKVGSAKNGSPAAGTGKDSNMYLMGWYTAWGGGLGQGGNWAWRIGSSHTHQGYQNPVASYALSDPAGGLIPKSNTAKADWNATLKRQLEFYTWLQSHEGAIGGGATNSYGGAYKAYPSGTSTFYDMAYQEAPVYRDPDSNTWFGMQAWSMERVAELYYILAQNGDLSSENFQMAKKVISKWIDWSKDYVFVNERPVTDSQGYYLDASGQRILGGTNVQVATTPATGEFWIPGSQEWNGQPDSWTGFSSYTNNPNFRVTTKDPSQDVGVLGSYIKTLTFFAAATKAEHGAFNAQGQEAKDLAEQLLDTAWDYNDGVGIVSEEVRKDYFRFFAKEIYLPANWTGSYGQGNALPGTGSIPSDPAKGGNGVYIGYSDLRPKIKQDPAWAYLDNLYKASYNPETKQWENGAPTFTYHRFWSQVDMATAYGEFERLLGDGSGPETEVPAAPNGLTAAGGSEQVVLNWNSVSGANSYTVKRAEADGGPYTAVAANVNGTTYTDTGLTNGKTYYYVVTAVNAAGESAASAQASAVPQAGSALPGAFTLVGTAGDAQAVLAWAASDGADSYAVQRRTGSGAFEEVAAGLTALTYTDAAAVNGTTYTYRIAASNGSGQTLSNEVTLTPTASPAGTGTLEVQYRNGGTGASGNAITPQFNLKNTGTEAIDLSQVKVRYYFTKDGNVDMSFWCDYAQIGSSNVEAAFIALNPAKGNADTVLEIGFKPGAGSLAPGAETGVIQGRFSKTNWASFDQTNDYSYDGAMTDFAAWNKVTAHIDGVKAWGVEP